MSPWNRIRLGKALRMARMARQAFNGVSLEDFEKNDCLDPSDAYRSLDEAVHFLRSALGESQGDEARDE